MSAVSQAAEASRAPSPGDADALLVQGLGTRQLAASIFNYTVGSGIFALPALVVARVGAAAPLPYLLCAFLMALVGLIYAEAGSRVSGTGGTYVYVKVGLGTFPAFVAALFLLLADIAAVGAVATLLAGSVVRLLGLGGAAWEPLIATVLILGLAGLNLRGLRTGARVIEAATVAKLLPLVALVVVGAFFVHPANLRWTALPPARDITAAAGVLLFAFTGIGGALQPSGEVAEPNRTVPRAILLGLGAVTVLYLAIQLVSLGLMGPALARDPIAPLAAAAATFAGSAGRQVLLIAATVSTFGWLTGAILASPRALFALGRDGFLPGALASVHLRYRTPHVAIIAFALIGLALALSGTFESLAVLSALSSLASYFLCAAALIGLRRRDVRQTGEPFRAPGGPLLPYGGCALMLVVAWQTIGVSELRAGGLLLLVATLFYGVRALRRRAAAATAGGSSS